MKARKIEPIGRPDLDAPDTGVSKWTTFSNKTEEKLYAVYISRQKSDMVDSFCVFSVLYVMYVLTVECAMFHQEKLVKITIFIALLVLNVMIIVVCHIQRISVKWRTAMPFVLWVFLTLGVFVELMYMSSYPSGELTWVLVLVNLTYLMLPTKLVMSIFISSLVTLGHVTAAVVIWCQKDNNVTLLGNQISADLLLLLCAHLLGVIYHVMSDLQHRRSFLQTRASLTVRVSIEQESKQQERLLLSVLPKHVANQMLRDWGAGDDGQFRKIFLTRYENVSILFADIVGFTAISSSCTAAELVKILNELFASFDKLANRFHQHRIKILGDCYYCVCGAPDPRPDHAILCVHMGLNVVLAIADVRKKTEKDVNMRVGIHTGAVLGGVLGLKQWQYDVLGKEVMLANKMESGGVPGRVHISEVTKSFLHGEFELEPGNGDQREDYIRLLGLKTYLIKSVLKPLKQGAVKHKTSEKESAAKEGDVTGKGSVMDKGSVTVVSLDSEGETVVSEPPKVIHEDGYQGNEKIDVHLQEALLERDSQSWTSNQISPFSLNFTNRKLEDRYQSRRGCSGGMASVGMCLVAVFTFLARVCVLPVSNHVIISFVVGGIVLVSMTTVSVAYQVKQCGNNCLGAMSKWISENNIPRSIWTVVTVLAITGMDITHSFGCVPVSTVNITIDSLLLPTDTTCRYPPYFIHTGSLVFLGIAGLMQIGHVTKLMLVVVIILSYGLVNILLLGDTLDLYDVSLHTRFEREHLLLPAKYRMTAGLAAVAMATVYLGRQTSRISRKLFLWSEETERQKEQVAQLRIKNEALVYNLLPGHVAKDFLGSQKNDEELYSHGYDEVGVIFAACPNFHDFYNESSVNNNGLECFRFLNEIISDYDELLEKANFASICKIKTVGPTYMAASGMANSVSVSKESGEQARWKHLDDLVQFAFSMKETLQRINEQSFNNFNLRIGLNHGPVIAGVIGARKPHYDIWGNTVNVASRMESTGHVGKIQVVEETMHLLAMFGYRFQRRGLIRVKGKGELMTYFIEDKHVS